jgi:hypothetical protein
MIIRSHLGEELMTSAVNIHGLAETDEGASEGV